MVLYGVFFLVMVSGSIAKTTTCINHIVFQCLAWCHFCLIYLLAEGILMMIFRSGKRSRGRNQRSQDPDRDFHWWEWRHQRGNVWCREWGPGQRGDLLSHRGHQHHQPAQWRTGGGESILLLLLWINDINYEWSHSKFVGTVLTSTMLQTKSRGLDTNILEIKTWQFTPYGANVVIFG